MLSEKMRAKSVERLAEMRQFSSELAHKISLVLHNKLGSLGKQSRRSYGGIKSVAELLNTIDQTSGKAILEAIEQAHQVIKEIVAMQDELVSQCGKPKVEIEPLPDQSDLTRILRDKVYSRLPDALRAKGKFERKKATKTLYDEVMELRGGIANFSSLLRVACVLYLRRPELLAHLPQAALA